MGNYIKQLSSCKVLLNGKDFHFLTEEIHKEIEKDKWIHYSWQNEIVKLNNFTQIAKFFGMTLVYEENIDNATLFSIDIDGAYNSAFLLTLFKIMAPYTSDGFLNLIMEGKPVSVIFNNGEFKIEENNESNLYTT